MKVVVLAAGYGTRLGPVAENRPKALLPVGGRPVLDHLVEGLAPLDPLGEVHLVTNHRFADQFREWRRSRTLPFPVHVIDDGTVRPDERLGAVGDLALAVESTGSDTGAVVAGSDNLFEFPFRGLLETFRTREDAAAVVTVVEEGDPERLRTSGVPEVDDDGRVLRFHEKPEDPPASLLAPPLYLLGGGALRDVRRYLEEGGRKDAPGHFLEWLVRRRTVLAWRAPGARHDIGTPERYAQAQQRFGGSPDT